MIKKLLILVFIISSINCFSIEAPSKPENRVLENKINELEKRSNEKDYAKEIIQEYKDLNNLYSIGFGILIGLFGFAFPTLIYFIQIKPSIDVTKESKALLKKLMKILKKVLRNI